ncbi:MFS transporter [Chelatococcus reniformis]|uniref:MFS transporter n=1 Tax=Chelatococcus reniformis TaxID=1494448 RepID=A0A916UKX7_9HYPH|nr:MFS transporter [Chelatococcus reniformis]GGC74703.1 MFS transporter [Chelatococcus reniformis]
MDALATATTRADERLPFGQVLIAIGGIYLAQSLVGSLTFQGVPAVLRSTGAELDTIGLVALVMLPWALKFLWAPYVERYRLPVGRSRRSRRIVVAGEAIAILALIGLAFTAPAGHAPLFMLLGAVALASATVDIACDAFAIEQLAPAARGWGNTAQVGGGYLGILVGSGLFLILVSTAGWTVAVLSLASMIAVLTLPFALAGEPGRPLPPGTARPSLRAAWARPAIRWGLLLTVAFEIGVRLVQGMIGPLLIDGGLDLATLGMINGLGGVIAGVSGTLAGGALVRALGARRAVLTAAALQALTLALLAAAVAGGLAGTGPLVGLVLIQAAAMAIGFVALYSLLMGLASPAQAGVDFTLFQCADALVAGLCGFGGGVLAKAWGYGPFFVAAAALAVAGVLAMPFILRRSLAQEQQQ